MKLLFEFTIGNNFDVATVLTVYGIETRPEFFKPGIRISGVATVLTVYGIETAKSIASLGSGNASVATVLTVYGIETNSTVVIATSPGLVATVLTVYGIETDRHWFLVAEDGRSCNSTYRLRY